MVTTADSDVVTLDVLDPAYRIDGPEVRAAREANWYARTPMGIAVLRHDEISQLLTDRRLVQGSHLILAAQGVLEGPVPDFFNSIILSVEGDDHTRLRLVRQHRPGGLRPGRRRLRHHRRPSRPADLRRRHPLLPGRQPGPRRDGAGPADPGPQARADRGGGGAAVASGAGHHRPGDPATAVRRELIRAGRGVRPNDAQWGGQPRSVSTSVAR